MLLGMVQGGCSGSSEDKDEQQRSEYNTVFFHNDPYVNRAGLPAGRIDLAFRGGRVVLLQRRCSTSCMGQARLYSNKYWSKGYALISVIQGGNNIASFAVTRPEQTAGDWGFIVEARFEPWVMKFEVRDTATGKLLFEGTHKLSRP